MIKKKLSQPELAYQTYELGRLFMGYEIEIST